MIEEFLLKFKMPLPPEPTLHDVAYAFHRLAMLEEEFIEYQTALILAFTSKTEAERDKYFEDMVDALGDLIYSAAGTALTHGFDIRAALKEIHRANMAKERGIGNRGHQCDVIKPPGWEPPQHNLRKRPRDLTTGDLFDSPTSSSSDGPQGSLQLLLPGM